MSGIFVVGNGRTASQNACPPPNSIASSMKGIYGSMTTTKFGNSVSTFPLVEGSMGSYMSVGDDSIYKNQIQANSMAKPGTSVTSMLDFAGNSYACDAGQKIMVNSTKQISDLISDPNIAYILESCRVRSVCEKIYYDSMKETVKNYFKKSIEADADFMQTFFQEMGFLEEGVKLMDLRDMMLVVMLESIEVIYLPANIDNIMNAVMRGTGISSSDTQGFAIQFKFQDSAPVFPKVMRAEFRFDLIMPSTLQSTEGNVDPGSLVLPGYDDFGDLLRNSMFGIFIPPSTEELIEASRKPDPAYFNELRRRIEQNLEIAQRIRMRFMHGSIPISFKQ